MSLAMKQDQKISLCFPNISLIKIICPVVVRSTVFGSDSKIMSSDLVENSVECL